MTALLASLVSDNIDSLQVALAQLMYNIIGIFIWYPIPLMRRVPLDGARTLGRMSRIWRGFPLVYIAFVIFLIPLSSWVSPTCSPKQPRDGLFWEP